MPELPDVEIARRRLQRWLVGGEARCARCDDARLLRPASPRVFERTLAGRTVVGLSRRGKWLRIELDDGGKVFSHLGMTGGWVRVAADAPPQRFERARIDVTKRGRLASVRYVDSRRFGRLLPATRDIDDWTALGPDPLADGIDVPRLTEVLAKGRRAVKEILMDQRVLAGVGNILATEALWIARVDPRSPGNALPSVEIRSIAKAIGKAIHRELADRRPGADYDTGDFYIYGRAGQPCPRCGTRLSSVVLGGRTSAYCAKCQRRQG